MGDVVQLVRYKSPETGQVLRALADMADAGECVGVALCFRTQDHHEQVLFTGAYRESAAAGVSAANRLSWHMTQIQNSEFGSP